MSLAKKTSYFQNNNIINNISLFSYCIFIISFLIGTMDIYFYFLSEKMFSPIDFNTLIFAFSIGLLTFVKVFMIVIPVTFFAFFILKYIFPQKKLFNILSVFAFCCLVGVIFFDKSVHPNSLVRRFSKGSYSTTLVLNENGYENLKDSSFLKITPQRTIENVMVLFKNKKIIYLKIDNEIITLSKKFVLTELTSKNHRKNRIFCESNESPWEFKKRFFVKKTALAILATNFLS